LLASWFVLNSCRQKCDPQGPNNPAKLYLASFATMTFSTLV
jgi:hypothetical protein